MTLSSTLLLTTSLFTKTPRRVIRPEGSLPSKISRWAVLRKRAPAVVDVLRYGERLKVHGLNLLSAPGNDAVATSALAGAGCHMVLFSTGRGTPYGGFVPTVKIATNSELAAKKKHWIDFDAGQLLHGKTMPQLLEEFVDAIVAFANGKPTCNEQNDFRELAIFKSGVTL